MNELLPCPFCGGDAVIQCICDTRKPAADDWWVSCRNCRVELPSTRKSEIVRSRDEAIAAWNRRQVDAPPQHESLDMPNGIGYWAFEGFVGDNPEVMPRQDVVWVHNIELGIIVSTWGDHKEYLHHYHGKWTRLHTPWDSSRSA